MNSRIPSERREARWRRKDHRDCYEFYWPQAKRNPIRQRHVYYYFVYRVKWVDVHISIIVPTKEDDEIFTAFDRSLRHGS